MTSIPPDVTAPPEGRAQVPTSVYRYYDRHGALIYVGITKQGAGRNYQHNSAAEWWTHVARQEVEHHPDRPAAAAREKELIRQYRPPFNKQHNIGWQDLRAAYVAWAGASETSPTSPLDAYRRAGRLIPLEVHDFDGNTLVARTRLEHAYLVPYLFIPAGTRVEGGGRKCSVGAVRVIGNFALMDCRIRRELPLNYSIEASIRWRQSTIQSREHVAVQRVIVRGEGAA